MAKNKRDSRADLIDAKNGKGVQVVQSEEHDDTPLPTPEDLAKYKELDPKIVDWLMKVSEKEQDFRHKFENDRLVNIRDVNKKLFTVDITRIICAFLVVVCGFGLSYFLIDNEKQVAGTIFGGTIILGSVGLFLNFKNNKNEVKKNN